MSIYDDDADVFIDTDWCAESITVYPDGTTPRTVNAVVLRKPPQLDQQRRVLEKVVQVRMANNATTGLAMSELILGKTKVRLAADRVGGTLETLLVRIPDDGNEWHDAAMIRLFAR